jgi:hypothetical protein
VTARDLFRGDRTKVVVWTPELAGEILAAKGATPGPANPRRIRCEPFGVPWEVIGISGRRSQGL